MGHSGAFSGEARPLSGEGPQPRGHAATRSRHQARQLLAHSRQVSQHAVGAEPLTSVASLSEHVVSNHAPTITRRRNPSGPTWREAARTLGARANWYIPGIHPDVPLSHPPGTSNRRPVTRRGETTRSGSGYREDGSAHHRMIFPSFHARYIPSFQLRSVSWRFWGKRGAAGATSKRPRSLMHIPIIIYAILRILPTARNHRYTHRLYAGSPPLSLSYLPYIPNCAYNLLRVIT